jgi:ABC-2 type transport system permease protein
MSARVGISPGGASYLAASLAADGLLFLSVGIATSQLASTRRRASWLAGGVLGIAYAVRVVADAGLGVDWLIWLSPLGWVEKSQPLTSPHPLPFLVVAASSVVLVMLSVALADRRDVGTGYVASRSHAAPQLRFLGSQEGLTFRLVRPSAIAWMVSLALAGLLFGLVAKAAGSTLADSSVNQVLSRLGARGGGVDAYLGAAFLLISVLVAFAASGQVVAAGAEERDGRLSLVIASPVTRVAWLRGRVAVASTVVIACSLAGAAGVWAGTVLTDAGVGVQPLVTAGIEAAAPALCVLGLGILALGVAPRACTAFAYGLPAWSLLIILVASIGATGSWMADTSVFHFLPAVPGVPPDWQSAGVLVAVGAVSAAGGAFTFGRRDLLGG